MSQDKQELFRKEALEERSTTHDLDTLMTVVNAKTWLAIAAASGLALLFFLWTIFGIIPDEVSGTAIVMHQRGNFTVAANQEAEVERIFVEPGQFIKEGEVLVKLSSPKLDLRISNLKTTAEMLKRHLEDYAQFFDERAKASETALNRAIDSSRSSIQRIDSDLVALNEDFRNKESLYRRRILAEPVVIDAKEKINQKLSEREQAQANILERAAQLKRVSDLTEMQRYENELSKVNKELSELELQREKLTVVAPHTGRILTVPIHRKGWVNPGDLLVWAEHRTPGDDGHILYGYFTSAKDQRIRVGQTAQVRLNNVDYKRYGELLVKVADVWTFPVSSHELYKIVGNQNIVNFLTQEGGEAAVQVLFEPIADSNTPTGYKWTSREGPPELLDSGTIGHAKVSISSRRPIEFVFPMFREIRDSVTLSKIERQP